ncbi:cation channel sperm-associated protein subunit gamma-like [Dromiciops gliroides]|uniref:cation channel sperm-associated protein subunit gamma-like n=1 Tax=Dromiciops gliroides TaxID=33562 RepID=UPI001CC5A368|nr:cation channel sperm-associated protein subunit gamma-like [Dromiciops gliroides]
MNRERARGRSRCSSASLDAAHDSLPGLSSSGLPTLMVSLLLLLLLLLPLPVQLWIQLEESCQWQVVLNKYDTLGEGSERFFYQNPVSTVDRFFNKLVDSPINHKENYLGFPYFMKINFSCPGEAKEAFVRGGHLKGLFPIVLVTFHTPVNFRRWKSERLQIQMEGAPFRMSCSAEHACAMSWYTPMPMKNGSVVMEVEISSNKMGEIIGNARYMININGFLKQEKDKLIFTLGNEVRPIIHRDFINTPSRPVWATVDQAPVLILGGIPDEKMILLSDSSFRDISLVELNIDSCWLGSLHCPQEQFTASIFDTISTESTLFIRQNQLVYYFTGDYFQGPEKGPATSNWVRVLHSRCIKKLCPVELHSNGSEYVLALAGGNEEGFFHFGTITDGKVTFKRMPNMRSTCDFQKAPECWLHWVVYNMEDDTFFLLMEFAQGNKTRFQVLKYSPVTTSSHLDSVHLLFQIPPFIPMGEDIDFVMLLGMEKYTDYPLVPRGLFHNPFSQLLFIWGNAILQSYDHKNYIYLAGFPKESSIKYMASSYKGQVVCVTETEEIWFIVEGSFKVYRLYPSEGWEIIFSLSQMEASGLYSTNETSISIFYDSIGLQQLVYLVDQKGEGRLVKRQLPVNQILVYQLLGLTTYEISINTPLPTLFYSNPCPFELMQLRDLPNPQRYTRLERYRAEPPFVSSEAGFHSKVSLAIYQGLVYHLLWLHSKYNKPYADPVHDPTWRWWKDKKQHKAFYSYKASNFQTEFGVYINMDSYGKLYNQKAMDFLPEYIYLDKGTIYTFSIYLVTPKTSWKNSFLGKKKHLRLAVILSHPLCVSATVEEKYLINRNAILFQVSVKDKLRCFDQSISGHNLMKTALLIKVVGSAGKCFLRTRYGHLMQGNDMIPMFIGCPPGKRLAFDITLTLQYNKETNRRYFDCVYPDPEMPCFLFSDPFFPFFLIQDMVTGESGSFNGSYVLKVIGGGTSLENIVDYSEADIFRYNSPNDTTESLIWTNRDNWTDSHSFSILRYNSSGIEWLCMENSPCHDIIPKHIFSPDFYFKIMVSNRGVDTSTYCDYQLIFILHIHGLPLSSGRALFYLWVSLTVNVGFIFLYISWCFFRPHLKKWWSLFKWKVNDIIMAESFSTYSSSSSSVPSTVSFKGNELQSTEMEPSPFRKPRPKKKP